MKLSKITIVTAISLLLFSCSQKEAENKPLTPNTNADTISYAIGFDMGHNFLKTLSDDSLNINMNFIYQGILDGMKEDADSSSFLLTAVQMKVAQQLFEQQMQEKQARKKQLADEKYEARKKTALEDGKKFLEANKTKPGVVVETSGMQYKIITEGKGDVLKADDIIKVLISTKFIDGEEFQFAGKGPIEVPFAQFDGIKGMKEAFSKMPVGSKWEVVLPPNLAFGEQDTGIVPPNSVIIFELELLDIVKPQSAPQAK